VTRPASTLTSVLRRRRNRRQNQPESERPYDLGDLGPRPRRFRGRTTESAGECCAEAACEGVCGMLTMATLFRIAAATWLELRTPTPAPGPGRTRSARTAVTAIRVYQRRISPTRPPCCRFTPTCSGYAAEAVTRHGALRGGFQAARRLHRCGRRSIPGGLDPVR
jgi:putative membrane protein insertion efficiency factor